MKIAVTGASGRVGRAVVDLALAEGHDVVSIDRAPNGSHGGAFVRADMTDYEALVGALGGCDAVVHLAAVPGPGLLADHVVHNNNVVSSYNALRAAAEVGIQRVAQASSVNAVGGRFSRVPRYDYFPLDEAHATHAEDPYSLSKWICEQQADSIARRYETMSVASLRLHAVVADPSETFRWIGMPGKIVESHLWGYTNTAATARAFLQGVTAEFTGHEAFFIVAPDTMMDTPSLELAAEHYPDVPVVGDLSGHRGFYDCSKARDILGWHHDVD